MKAHNRCLGVDLGTSSVKIAEVVLEGGVAKVVRAVEVDTNVTPAMSADERRAAIIAAAKDAIKQGGFKTKNAVFGVSGLKVFIRRFTLPSASEERLRRIVLYEAKEQIPFPLDMTELQYQFFPPREGGGDVDVLLVAIRRDDVLDYMKTADKLGLTGVFVSVSPFALFNTHSLMRLPAAIVAERIQAMRAKPGKKGAKKKAEPAADAIEEGLSEGAMSDFVFEEVKAYVNIGASSVDISIARNAKDSFLGFNRTPPVGGVELTRAIMSNLDIQSYSDAERIKRTSTKVMGFDFGFEEEGEVNEEASMAVTDALERVVNEIRRTTEYYISQPDGVAVDSIELSGGQAQLPSIAPFIEERLTVPTNVVESVPEGSGLVWGEGKKITPFLVAIGYALQGVGLARISVDFLPSERKITRDFPYKAVAVMVFLVIGMVAIAMQSGSGLTETFGREADTLRQEMERQRTDIEYAGTVQAKHRQVAEQILRVSKPIGQREYWLEFLAGINRAKPSDLVITSFEGDHEGVVVIRGLSESLTSCANFVEAINLMLENPRAKAELGGLSEVRRPEFERPVTEFEIRLTTSDKINHLGVTPTPLPGAAGAGGDGNQPPRANQPGPRGGPR